MLLLILAVGGLLLLLGFRIWNMPAGLSPAEHDAIVASGSWRAILDNPLYAPHKIIQFVLQVASLRNIGVLRAVSVFWGFITVVLFFNVLRNWYNGQIAALGTLLFACSTWFLVTTRLATPEIMLSGIVALMAMGGWLRFSKARNAPLLLAIFITAAFCYIPGMVWFIAVALIWQRRSIRTALQESSPATSLFGALLFLLLISPLLVALIRMPEVGRSLIGLPQQLPPLTQIGHDLLAVPLALFVKAPYNPAHWLGRLPLLDVFTAIMFALGLYSFFYQRHLDRVKMVVGLLIAGSILIAVSGGAITYTILLPAVYVVIIEGISLMLQQWLTVFPRNPLARTIGVTLLITAVVASCYYQVNRYYVAWQHAPSTKQIYNQH